MYKVISNFTDLKDGNRHYKVGEIYPRDGYTPTAERIEYLLSNKTKRKSPVIEEVVETEEVESEDAEKPKRTRRTKKKQ